MVTMELYTEVSNVSDGVIDAVLGAILALIFIYRFINRYIDKFGIFVRWRNWFNPCHTLWYYCCVTWMIIQEVSDRF